VSAAELAAQYPDVLTAMWALVNDGCVIISQRSQTGDGTDHFRVAISQSRRFGVGVGQTFAGAFMAALEERSWKPAQ